MSAYQVLGRVTWWIVVVFFAMVLYHEVLWFWLWWQRRELLWCAACQERFHLGTQVLAMPHIMANLLPLWKYRWSMYDSCPCSPLPSRSIGPRSLAWKNPVSRLHLPNWSASSSPPKRPGHIYLFTPISPKHADKVNILPFRQRGPIPKPLGSVL